MSITFKLWDSSSNSITFEPDWGADESALKTYHENRAQLGYLYRYTYGHWKVFKFNVNLLPNSAAVFVNSLWMDHVGCQLEIDLDGNSDVYSVFIENKELPFNEYGTPTTDRLNGKLKLVEY